MPSAPTHCFGSIPLTRFSQKRAAFSHTKDIRPDSWLSVHALEVPSWHWYSKLPTSHEEDLTLPTKHRPRRVRCAHHLLAASKTDYLLATEDFWFSSRLSLLCTCGRIGALLLEPAVCHATIQIRSPRPTNAQMMSSPKGSAPGMNQTHFARWRPEATPHSAARRSPSEDLHVFPFTSLRGPITLN